MWFVYGKKPQDWQATLIRRGDGSGYHMISRFRFIVDDISEDKKQWLEAIAAPSAPIEMLINGLHETVQHLLRTGFNDKHDFLDVNGDFVKMVQLMSEQSWCTIYKEKMAQA